MSSSRQKEAQTSEPLPCPECGALQLVYTLESCQTEDGLSLQHLRHLKCEACGALFFDDDAMHQIQNDRAKRAIAHAV